ncbi:MAG: hypothetical protein ACI3XT_04190 [Butyricicoccaceae bacterium]
MKKWLEKLWPLLLVLCLGLIFDGVGRLLHPVPDLTFAQTESIDIRLSNAVIRQAISRAFEELDGQKWKADPDLPAGVRACSENDIIFYHHQGLPLAKDARQEILDLIPRLRPVGWLEARRIDTEAETAELSIHLHEQKRVTSITLQLYNEQYAYFSVSQNDWGAHQVMREVFLRVPMNEARDLIDTYTVYCP